MHSLIEKFMIYVGVIIAEVLLILLVSHMLNVGTEGTWLGTIGVNIVFLTKCIMFHDMAKLTKAKSGCASEFAPFIFYFFMVIFIIFIIMNNVLFFVLR